MKVGEKIKDIGNGEFVKINTPVKKYNASQIFYAEKVAEMVQPKLEKAVDDFVYKELDKKVKSDKKVKMGKTSRAAGKAFEKRVEQDLEKKGWIVIKFGKQVEFENKVVGGPVIQETMEKTIYNASNPLRVEKVGKLVNCKPRFNPFTHSVQMMSGGFPDFICFQYGPHAFNAGGYEWKVQLVESKMTGKLDKIEKEKIEWIKNNLKIPVLVASKGNKKGEIIYETI